MSWARAPSSSFLTLGTVAMQRGRAPQFPFMKSRTRSAVGFGSTVTGLSSGTGGGFTLAHSVVTSLAKAGMAPSVAMAAIAVAQDSVARCFMLVPSRENSSRSALRDLAMIEIRGQGAQFVAIANLRNDRHTRNWLGRLPLP